MIAFLPIPAGEDVLAGVPSSGLVGLFKCDERTGDKLYDATGNLQPIQLYTGAALDCTTTHTYLVDGTALHTALNGDACDATVTFAMTTPALAANGRLVEMCGGVGTSGANTAPIRVYLTESNTFTGGNRYTVTAVLRLSNDGGAVGNATATFPATAFSGLAPSTAYQCILKFRRTGTTSLMDLYYRPDSGGPWAVAANAAVSSATGTAVTYVTGGAAFRLLVLDPAGATDNDKAVFLGKIRSLCIANGLSVADAKTMFDESSKSSIRSILTGIEARYWDFQQGSGTDAQEWTTDAAVALTSAGTVTWAVAQAGGGQTALRQGVTYDGPVGVRIGGESGFAAGVGYGASAANSADILSSPDGWTVIATLRTSNRIPSSDQFLFSVYGPQLDGSYSTTPTIQPGAHLVLDDAGLIRGVFKRTTTATGGTGTEQAAGVTSDSPSNGLLGTYAIVCSSAGVVTTRRILSGESSVTVAATSGASTANLATYATRVAIGNASFGADLVLGFGAIYNRPITDAEIVQCHNMALARMRGAQSYVLAAATAGNGTSRYPYGALLSAGRTAQDYQTINIGAGSYTRLDTTASGAMTTGADFITLQGAGITSTTITGGTAGTQAPIRVEAGTWVISDMKLDGADDGAAPGDGHGANNCFTTGISSTVVSTIFNRVHFYNARAADQTGTGLVSRALHVELNDCEASSNGEHGVYLRIASYEEGDHRAVIRGLYCHDNAEDGLKFASDRTTPSDMPGKIGWDSCIIDRVKVDGGQNQLWLAGVKNSVITNCLLINKSDTGLDTGALYLGYPLGSGTTVNEDFCDNNTIANVTIYNASGAGIYDARSANTTLQNVICSQGDDDLVRGTDGTATLSYCAGDANSNKIDTGSNNLVDATISFTNAAGGVFTLASGSDGENDGVNLTGLSDEAEADYAGTARPTTGAWNMGAY